MSLQPELVKQAILRNRENLEYQVRVDVDSVKRSYGIAGIRFPASVEAYMAEVYCTVHPDSPCFWIDFAFYLPHEHRIRVVTLHDLLKPGQMIEDGVRALIDELTRAVLN